MINIDICEINLVDNFKESLELNKFLAQKLILDQDPQNIEKVMNCSN